MARILILTPQLPFPPHQGTTIRNLNLIMGLARRHTLDLLSFGDPGAGSPAAVLRQHCRAVTVVGAPPVRALAQRARDTLLSPQPDMALRLASAAMHAGLAQALADNEYDVLQVEGIEMARYMPDPGGGRPWLVFDDHNAEFLLQKRACLADARLPSRWHAALYSLVQWRKLERYERAACLRADRVVAVSDADRRHLERLAPGASILTAPNGVDLAQFSPGITPAAAGMGPAALVFTGKMDYRPNIDAVLWFADEVLPAVRRQAPEARFFVVGQRPHARLAPLRGRPDITVTGEVADVRPYIAGAAVYVVPLRMGGGTRLKVLEAMAMGAPVVSTRLGCDGFAFAPGQQALLEDSAAGFAAAIVSLLHDRARAAALGQAGRSYVAAHYGWGAIIPLLEDAYPHAPGR